MRLVILMLLVVLAACSHEPSGPVVQTRSGPVQGFEDNGVQAFYGIPYAAPPVGQLRWAAPATPASWQSTLLAVKAPSSCFQYMLYMQRGEEDCLYLNVFTPSVTPSSPLPVMVWIHGGGFIGGNGLEATPGDRLSKHGNVVIVSINYRLGAQGFLAHPALSKEQGGHSGNYGLMDQQAALRWVQDNIRVFGGDPGNVTIFGESAGGMSVCSHLAAPGSRGLFHKAIIQSGPCTSHNGSLKAAERQGELLAANAGCGNAADAAACLRSKTAEEILNALPNDPAFVFGKGTFGSWMPIVDGNVLTQPVWKAMQEGDIARVPVINGANGDEGTIMVMFSHEYRREPLEASQYRDRIEYLVGNKPALIDRISERYPVANPEDPGAALAEMFGDGFMYCPIQQMNDVLAMWMPTYAYTFAYPDATFILPEARTLKAFHGAELQFVFNAPMTWLKRTFEGDEQQLSIAMMDYWSNFARHGDPNGDNSKHLKWPAWHINGQQLVLDRQLSLAGNPKQQACEFWKTLDIQRSPLQQYESH